MVRLSLMMLFRTLIFNSIIHTGLVSKLSYGLLLNNFKKWTSAI